MAKQTYNSENIKILKGLEAVRERPGMYIGSTGERGLHHILWEIIDNSVDEATNGYASHIIVTLYPDGSASVEDDGRGMPVDIHKEAGVSGVEVIFTKLHAGGKFDSSNYSYAGGLHGVGASVTNALSEWLKVEVYNGTIYTMEFKSHLDNKGEMISGDPVAPLLDTKVKTKKHGTFVRFKPDKRVFTTVEFKAESIENRLRETSFLNKGLTFELIDKRKDENAQPIVIKSEGGIVDYVKYINRSKNALYPEPFYFTDKKEYESNGKKDEVVVEISLQHTDEYSENIYTFVNNIPTRDGGTHDIGFKMGLTKFFNEYVKNNSSNKLKGISFNGEDFRTGITAVVTVKMKNAQFEGQTKEKLGNVEVRPIVDSITNDGLTDAQKNRKYSKNFDAIIDKALSAAKEREAVKRAKEISRAKNSAESAKLLGKLAGCSCKDASLNEIFFVEGDSAGGTAKEGRDRKHQAILPLRGKTLNIEKKSLLENLKNDELKAIVSALGTGIGSGFELKDLNYDKIIILSDADVDGYHIRCLLLTFFYRYMKKLIETGHVYIGMPPLYKVYKKDMVEYAYNDEERIKAQEKVGRGYQVQRYKGLGEMSAEQLWSTTLDPARRMLLQVSIEDAAQAETIISTLMGDAVEERKKYIQTYADFNKKDDFDVR